MKYLVKYSPEITIKSRPVRARFVRQLRKNLARLLARQPGSFDLEAKWDYIEVTASGSDAGRRLERILETTPGIAAYSRVSTHPLGDMEDMAALVLDAWRDRLAGRTFAVRCKRAGRHAFTSVDVERYVGGALNQRTEARGVSLSAPEVTVKLEIRDQEFFIIDDHKPGLGGFPLGSQDAVLSLISGGFDSAVSSYMAMRRGLRTHFCFFNLGGVEHEIAVKEVALYLWMKYGASHSVKFVTVPFEAVVGEILEQIDNSQMGVVLKRMMLRAATQVARELKLEALVTGESVAQVSSQTLPNLAVIDQATDMLVFRPLAMAEKQDIVDLARAIGTEEFSAEIPEYCGVISVKPTTRARLAKIEREEARFNFDLLDEAVAAREVAAIDRMNFPRQEVTADSVPMVSEPQPGAIIIDIRHPDEVDASPLELTGNDVIKVPFYKLNTVFSSDQLKPGSQYLLYCGKGIMSRLHGAYLVDQGFSNVGVYRPDQASRS